MTLVGLSVERGRRTAACCYGEYVTELYKDLEGERLWT